MNQLLLVFIALNIVNVIIQTVKSLCTINAGKGTAALVNALAYGFYTVVTVYMLCELPLLLKALIVALCNLVGVFVVKWAEEKARKDKLWKVEATIPKDKAARLYEVATEQNLSFNYVDINKYFLFNFYCPTQKDSAAVKELLNSFDAKYFVAESKNL